MQATSTSTVAQRLSRLALLYEKGQASELMDRTLDKLLTHEAEQSQAQLDELNAELSEIEQQYGMASDDFYRRFQAGQTDDRMDFVEWASLAQMAAEFASATAYSVKLILAWCHLEARRRVPALQDGDPSPSLAGDISSPCMSSIDPLFS